jgi:hypothetical protein
VNVTPETDVAIGTAIVVDTVASQDSALTPDEAPAACANCGTARSGRYCPACGQKALPLNPPLRYFLHELTHEVLNVDGKIFRSLRLLLTRPGFLTREIFAGKRASYVSPLRLYLVASVLAVAIGAFGGLDQANLNYTAEPGDTEAAVEAGRARIEAAERTLNTAFNVWLPRAMFVLVPLFAALVMLSRRGSGLAYPQHLYFALHVHAAGFFANALDSLFEAVAPLAFVAPVVDIVTELYIVAYFFLAFRRVYETTIWGTVWRGLTIGLVYIVVLMLAFVAIAAPTVWPLFTNQS